MAEKTLQDRIEAKQRMKTDWDTDKSTWEYITIPEEDGLGRVHASVSNNHHVFEAGKTYLVPPVVAADVRERLKLFNRECVRVLQPRRDQRSENQVAMFGTPGAQAVDPASIK